MNARRSLGNWFKSHIELLLVILLALLAAAPLFLQPGLLATRAGGDSPFLLQRTQQLVMNLRSGIFPARWMPDGALGYGYPFYDFYAPLPYYLAGVLDLTGLGTLAGIKLTQVMGMLLAALGCYYLAHELSGRRWAGLAAAAVYTYAPFHLVNLYVRGDSLGEFYAMGWFPWLIFGVFRLRRAPSAGGIVFLAAVFAALVLSHNISAMLFTPLVLLMLLLAALDHHTLSRWRTLGAGLAALVLGLALSAWFWLPALREQSLVQLQEQTTGYFNYAGHFRALDIVQYTPFFNYTVDGERNPFRMGLLQALLALAALVGTIVITIKRKRLATWQLGALLALASYTYMITPWSEWLWARLPLLPLVQFPWRLLSVQALAIILLVVGIVALLPERLSAWLVLPLAIIVTVAAMVGLKPTFITLGNADITSTAMQQYELYSGNLGSTVRAEYLPRWTVPRPYSSGYLLGLEPQPLALEGSFTDAEMVADTPQMQTWQVTAPMQSLLAFPTTYYPGWEAEVDGVRQGIEPLQGLGWLGLRLAPGTHTIRFIFEPTPTRRLSGYASVAAVAAWLGLLGWSVYQRRRFIPAVILIGSLAVLTVWTFGIPHPAIQQTTADGPLVQDFAWAPLLHREPGGIRFGDAHLLDYALTASELFPGAECEVSLTWERPLADYTLMLQLVSASAHLQAPAPVWAEASAEVGSSAMRITLPPDLPPGMYVLRFSVLRGGQAQPAVNSQGVEMGLLASSFLRVTAARVSAGVETVLGGFGPAGQPPVITLLSAHVAAREPGFLTIALTWRSEQQAPLNYQLSVRFKSSAGEQLAARDLAPFGGNWPTVLWRPGELYSDRVILPVPEEGLNGDDYLLEIVLYDRVTLQAVGTVQVPVTLP